MCKRNADVLHIQMRRSGVPPPQMQRMPSNQEETRRPVLTRDHIEVSLRKPEKLEIFKKHSAATALRKVWCALFPIAVHCLHCALIRLSHIVLEIFSLR